MLRELLVGLILCVRTYHIVGSRDMEEWLLEDY